MRKVLLTGATGFVGRAIADELLCRNFSVVAAVRTFSTALPERLNQVLVGDMLADTQWQSALQDVEVVIHSAARVHIMNEMVSDSLSEFRKVNVDGTLNLARQALKAGVKRFVFISSIKVNGESSKQGEPFKASDIINVTDPYALSKYEAEQGLLDLTRNTSMEVVIIRSPLVYGPGVKANFFTLLKWVRKGIPLPFGAVYNQRSFVAITNLVDFILLCMSHSKASNEVFLISDGKDLSTTALLQKISQAFGRNLLLIPVPVWMMSLFAGMLGKKSVADRLFTSLQVDCSKAVDLLEWKPKVTMDEELKRIADVF